MASPSSTSRDLFFDTRRLSFFLLIPLSHIAGHRNPFDRFRRSHQHHRDVRSNSHPRCCVSLSHLYLTFFPLSNPSGSSSRSRPILSLTDRTSLRFFRRAIQLRSHLLGRLDLPSSLIPCLVQARTFFPSPISVVVLRRTKRTLTFFHQSTDLGSPQLQGTHHGESKGRGSSAGVLVRFYFLPRSRRFVLQNPDYLFLPSLVRSPRPGCTSRR